MKTSSDPRHLERIRTMQDLFAWDFQPKEAPSTKLGQQVKKNLNLIDQQISQAAPAWPIEKINKVDLSILRLAALELLVKKKAPIKVIVDEAVELAKEYGTDSSAPFVNGVLGKLIIDNKIKI